MNISVIHKQKSLLLFAFLPHFFADSFVYDVHVEIRNMMRAIVVVVLVVVSSELDVRRGTRDFFE